VEVERDMNRIKIDVERQVGPVDPRIYGNFVEHLGRCVYGGVYDPGSPLSDADGVRLDVLEATQRLAPTQVRYPGGNFVSGYHWLDGVGPRDARPRRMELAWHTVETNQFGTNEFVQWCRRVPTEPVFCVNLGTGTVEEARDWLEYCNGTGDTHFAQLRRSHGFHEPHDVHLWDLGNEIDGDWQIGAKTADEYGRAAVECAKLMKWTDPSIELVACGDSFARDDWNRTVLRHLNGWANYLSVHMYLGRQSRDAQTYLVESRAQIERRIERVAAQITAEELRQPVAIAFDEWGMWLGKDHGGGYTLADGLVAALYLNAFIRHASMVRIANYAQLVNVIPTFSTTSDDLFLQATYFPLELFRHQNGPVALDAWCDAELLTSGGHAAPALDVTATLDPGQARVTVNVVNLDTSHPRTVSIESQRGAFVASGSLSVLACGSPEATNGLDAKDRLSVDTSTVTPRAASLTFEAPAHSLCVLRLPLEV